MTCKVCEAWGARTQRQLDDRKRNTARGAEVQPCPSCGGTDWATSLAQDGAPTDTLDVLRKVVVEVKYKPGYQFRLADKKGAWFLYIIDTECMDAYNPEQPMPLRHEQPVPMGVTYNERTWRRWIYEQCRRVENHEIGEWLRWGEERPFAPLHGPGEDPYTVHEYRDPADALVTQDGTMRISFGKDDWDGKPT